MSTIDSSSLVSLGVPGFAEGSPKNQVSVMLSLNGELVNDPPIKISTIATNPSAAGCQRNDQPSKGPGLKRPSGV